VPAQPVDATASAFYRSRLEANPCQKVFEDPGLWEIVEKGSPKRFLISARKPQGWPLYSRFVLVQPEMER
jgi:hypothetical protein